MPALSLTQFRVLFMTLYCAWHLIISTPAHAAQTIVTATGQSISKVDIRRRLYRLLRELGEPRWTRRDLQRLNRSVFAYIAAFTGSRYQQTLRALQRGNRYRPMIRARLAQAGLPLTLEALPMAESAYRFSARSRKGARGLWQYMPASARRYGLKVGRHVDQRTDPARATDAAIRYLKYLQRKFGNHSILLAIAAYNAGEGRIAKIIRKSGNRGYSGVARHLPRETRGYIPEFLAAALILKDPAHFGFPVARSQSFRYVQVARPLPLRTIARWAKMPVTRLKRLNPELKPFRRLPTSNYPIRLPTGAAHRVARKLAHESVWKPVSRVVAFDASATAVNRSLAGTSKARIIYRVKKGNHLLGIAAMFGVDLEQLRKINHLRDNRIHAGQLLVIPTRKQLVEKSYRVRRGDSLGRIAKRLGIPVRHLKFINGVTDPRRLKPGQQLYYYET